MARTGKKQLIGSLNMLSAAVTELEMALAEGKWEEEERDVLEAHLEGLEGICGDLVAELNRRDPSWAE